MDLHVLCALTTVGHTKSLRRVRYPVDARLVRAWCSRCIQYVKGRMASYWVRFELSLRSVWLGDRPHDRMCGCVNVCLAVGFEKIARTIFEDDDF
jgi:hypothetical protein